MYWSGLGILYLASLVLCAVGFYKFTYFLSIGYGFAVAGGGIAVLIMAFADPAGAPLWFTFLQAALFLAYGVRLSGFLLVRELKNVNFKKTDVAKSSLAKNGDKKMPVFVLIFIWIFVSALYVCQVSPMFFRVKNGASDLILPLIGMAISVGGLLLESVADNQKSAQKKEDPGMVATRGLYKLVRCPNYLGEIIFWTGVLVSGVTAFQNAGQWIMGVFAYIAIVFIMFNGAQRMEKRQNKSYGDKPEYQAYVKKTPIILPFIPLYSLNKNK